MQALSEKLLKISLDRDRVRTIRGGLRLIDHLRGQGMTNREARRALQSGKVYLGCSPTADPTRQVDPQQVTVRVNAPRVKVGEDLVIVHRDDDLAVVLKPAGMLSVPAAGRRGERTVVGEASRLLRGAHVVHRLDEGTSGLMMVARTPQAQQAIKDLLFVHDVERRYWAIVRGLFPEEPITMRNTLVRDRGDGLRGSAPDGAADGKKAVTHLRRVEALGSRASLVEAELETGRTHQVRIHLTELGHPVLGDRLYGGKVARAAPRLALHARRLGFRHPRSGERLDFEAPLPDDLERVRAEASAPPTRRRR